MGGYHLSQDLKKMYILNGVAAMRYLWMPPVLSIMDMDVVSHQIAPGIDGGGFPPSTGS